jgi:cysteine synthase A
MKIAENINHLIGQTPLIRLNRLSQGLDVTILAKMESLNPGGSVKDRLSIAMIETAEKEGLIKGDTVISVSMERRMIIKAYGAELVLTSAAGGMPEAIETARAIAARQPESFIPMQFSNPANAEMHRKTTALEIWNDTGGQVDIFVAGSGTGGTITGVSEVLKEKNPLLKSIVVEPLSSPVLSEGKPGKHKIQGIGPGFIPDVLNTKIYDEIFLVSDEDAFRTARLLTQMEGIFSGISSGANCHAALEVSRRKENKGKTVVFIVCDTGERYISTPLYNIE